MTAARSLSATALVLLFAGMMAGSADAQDVNVTELKGGIDRLRALPATVNHARNLLGPLTFGPYEIHGSCDFNCWGKLCWQTWHWNWNFPQFVGFKGALDQRLAAVSVQAATFDQAFGPVRGWLTGTLPAFSTYFDGAVQKLQADALVLAQPGDAAAVEKAKGDIVETLAQINTKLVSGSGELRIGVAQLSRFNAGLGSALGQVQSISGALDSSIASGRENMGRKMGDWPCGQGDATDQFNGISNVVRAQFDTVIQAANATRATATQSDKDVSLILGTVLNLQTRYQGALQQIQSAQITPQGAVQTLRVGVAAAEWHDLAQYAVQQLR